jgi:hypothetical protein
MGAFITLSLGVIFFVGFFVGYKFAMYDNKWAAERERKHNELMDAIRKNNKTPRDK